MKLEDVKVGKVLKDQHGNEYEVMTIDTSDDVQSVEVKCVKFKKRVCLSNLYISKIGDCEYLINDKSVLLSLDSDSGKKITENLKFTLLSNCFRPIKVSVGFDSQTFLVAHQETIDKIDVTLSDLEDISPDYLTENNVKLGMKVVDGMGNEYIVDDYVDESVCLMLNMQTSNVNGESITICMKTLIPFYDANNDEKYSITTKDFRIIKG